MSASRILLRFDQLLVAVTDAHRRAEDARQSSMVVGCSPEDPHGARASEHARARLILAEQKIDTETAALRGFVEGLLTALGAASLADR